MKTTKSKTDFDIDFISIIDPWKDFEHIEGMQNSKESLLTTYQKIDKFPLPPPLSLKHKCDIVVVGFSSYLLLSKEFQKKSHVVLRPKDLFRYTKYLHKCFRNFTLDLKVYKDVYKQLINKNKNQNKFNYIKSYLKKISPKFLIITSTIDPIQRLWAFYSNLLGIKVVCIQHGVFSSLSAPEVLERNIVDFYFSFCDGQSKLLENIIPKNKHINLYSEDFYIYKVPKQKKIKVCLIGTDHERYGLKGKKNKLSVLRVYERLIKKLKANNVALFEIVYKKHPSEELIGDVKKNVTIIEEDELNTVDIFFGVASTMLLNLAMRHRCAVQISSQDFIQDRYEDYGFCKTIDIEEVEAFGLKFLAQSEISMPCLKQNNFNNLLTDIIYDSNI